MTIKLQRCGRTSSYMKDEGDDAVAIELRQTFFHNEARLGRPATAGIMPELVFSFYLSAAGGGQTYVEIVILPDEFDKIIELIKPYGRNTVPKL